MLIRDRISEFLIYKGITRYKFYKLTGLSNGFLDKDGAINSDNCEKICTCFPDLNPEWLLVGRGQMIKIDNSESNPTPASEKDGKSAYSELLLNKIVELSSENTLLKQENESLKKQDTFKHLPFTEDDVVDGLAAGPAK
jgi:hypothetical protein